MSTIRLRYYTRFRGAYGHLSVMITHNGVRKYATLPIILSASQAKRLTHKGKLRGYTETSQDFSLISSIKHVEKAIYHICGWYIATNQYQTLQGKTLSNEIKNTLDLWENRNHKEVIVHHEGNRITFENLTPQQFIKILHDIQSTMTQEEYDALWEKGGKV